MNKNSIDLAYLKSISTGNELFELELLKTFVEQTTLEIKKMEESLRKREWHTVGAIAHKISPSFHFVGAIKTQELLNDIEERVRNKNDMSVLPARVSAFLRSVEQIIEAVMLEIENIEKKDQ